MASASEQEDGLGPGSEVGGYSILSELGVGGSGTVYKAKKIGTDDLVALKVMNAEHLGDDSERQRFEREAEVVKQLEHPHVVGLLDYGYEGALPFLVFPLLEGRTLEQRIAAEGKLGWGLSGKFSAQVLSALEKAHGMGIAHRDIKPANIFLAKGPDGETIRILDFGTAKIVGDKGQNMDVTRAGVLVGTPRYMSPEQVRGDTLTPAADVYAFGLVMTEMLVGKSLVTGASEFDIFVVQGSDKPHELPEEIKASPFASVIERAIAKPLEVRYRLASQMLADVQAILQRFGQGEQGPGEADLEATRFLVAPEPVAPNESAQKLRKAFNAIANKGNPGPAAGAPAAPVAGPPAPPPPQPEPQAAQAPPQAAFEGGQGAGPAPMQGAPPPGAWSGPAPGYAPQQHGSGPHPGAWPNPQSPPGTYPGPMPQQAYPGAYGAPPQGPAYPQQGWQQQQQHPGMAYSQGPGGPPMHGAPGQPLAVPPPPANARAAVVIMGLFTLLAFAAVTFLLLRR